MKYYKIDHQYELQYELNTLRDDVYYEIEYAQFIDEIDMFEIELSITDKLDSRLLSKSINQRIDVMIHAYFEKDSNQLIFSINELSIDDMYTADQYDEIKDLIKNSLSLRLRR